MMTVMGIVLALVGGFPTPRDVLPQALHEFRPDLTSYPTKLDSFNVRRVGAWFFSDPLLRGTMPT